MCGHRQPLTNYPGHFAECRSENIDPKTGLVTHRHCAACGETLFADEPDHTEETCPAA